MHPATPLTTCCMGTEVVLKLKHSKQDLLLCHILNKEDTCALFMEKNQWLIYKTTTNLLHCVHHFWCHVFQINLNYVICTDEHSTLFSQIVIF